MPLILGKNDMWNDVDLHDWLLCFHTLNYESAESAYMSLIGRAGLQRAIEAYSTNHKERNAEARRTTHGCPENYRSVIMQPIRKWGRRAKAGMNKTLYLPCYPVLI